MSDFFPTEDYTIPTTSNYFKFSDGENTFRVLSSAVVGYEYWNNDNKPVRSRAPFETIPADIRMVKNDREEMVPSPITHFWAFVVYNYEAKKIQILQLRQKSIMQAMETYIKNPKWGSPKEYDFIVTKKGSGFDTEYTTTVNPKAPLDENIQSQYNNMTIDLQQLFSGGDPFGLK
jgi:hypothetical protein